MDKKINRTGETAQQLRAFTNLPKDLGSIPITRMAVYTTINSSPGVPMTSSGLFRAPSMQLVHTQTGRQSALTHTDTSLKLKRRRGKMTQ